MAPALATPGYVSPLSGWIVPSDPKPNAANGIVLADYSRVSRTGFKGRGTIPEMQRQGITVEAVPNRAYAQPNGGLCLVLGMTEVMLLANPAVPNDGWVSNLEAAWSLDAATGTYLLPRQHSHAWFNVSGPAAAAFFAKICAIDLRPHVFANLSITQTSVARLNCVLVRADQDGRAAYHLLADSASAIYFAGCLVDAAGEFNGRWLGGT